jgi:histidyl-tRNA synthetase
MSKNQSNTPPTNQINTDKDTFQNTQDSGQFDSGLQKKIVLDSTPYKGTRDFYPDDLSKRNYIFETWRKTLNSFGFEEYDVSVLENAQMYKIKSGDELGTKQLYNFIDKGNREIALRPEMTPSLARIVSNKFGELKFPLRWYSIPNCFRYERPQKGRLREHWQLNVDIIGLKAGGAEVELINVIINLFRAFGADNRHFTIYFNHRKLLDKWLDDNNINNKKTVYKVLDDWFKTTDEQKKEELKEFDQTIVNKIFELNRSDSTERQKYLEIAKEFNELKLLLEIIPKTHPNIRFELNPCIIRGIAYYTGVVFEAFDNNKDNPRALFGGGRYDTLLEMFGKSAPCIGFGFGDVTIAEFLDNWNLWPNELGNKNEIIGIMPKSEDNLNQIFTEIIPNLPTDQSYDINYEYERSENKRYEALKKRGCDKIIKVGFD